MRFYHFTWTTVHREVRCESAEFSTIIGHIPIEGWVGLSDVKCKDLSNDSSHSVNFNDPAVQTTDAH